jgi:hypothetical protein
MTMGPISHTWNGVTATVYYLNRGDKISRHRHNVEHTTSVLLGGADVVIYGGDASGKIMRRLSGRPPEILPAGTDHEITAIEDGTIVMNMIAGAYTTTTPADGPPAQGGGVELHDGTVVAHEAA